MTTLIRGYNDGSLCETLPPIFWRGPPRTLVLASTRLCPSPTPFLPPLFNSKSIQLLIASREVLVHHIQPWHHHFESGRAGDNFLTATMLKVYFCGPLYHYEPLYLHGPFRFRVVLFTFIRNTTISPTWAPVGRVARGWPALALVMMYLFVKLKYHCSRHRRRRQSAALHSRSPGTTVCLHFDWRRPLTVHRCNRYIPGYRLTSRSINEPGRPELTAGPRSAAIRPLLVAAIQTTVSYHS